MTDLPHTNEGFIQKEETDFRKATDRRIYQQVGSDLNFLKDQRDSIVATATGIFGDTVQSFFGTFPYITDGSGNFQSAVVDSPNGKPFIMGLIATQISTWGSKYPMPMIGTTLFRSSLNSSLGASTSDTGNFPLLDGQFTNSGLRLYFNLTRGTPAQWIAGTSGNLYYTLVYPS